MLVPYLKDKHVMLIPDKIATVFIKHSMGACILLIIHSISKWVDNNKHPLVTVLNLHLTIFMFWGSGFAYL